MKKAILLFSVVGSVAISSIVAASSQTDTLCASADVFREVGYLNDAKKEYTDLLKGQDIPNCAVKGLLETFKAEQAKSAEPCALADGLLSAGYLKEAKASYAELLNGEVKPECASMGLIGVKEKTSEQWKETVSRAQALAAFGLHDEAREAIATRLAKDERLEIPDNLQYLSGGKVPVWRTIRRNLEPWARPILEWAAGIILLIMLWKLLLKLLSRMFAKYTLSIGEFENAALEDARLGKDFSSVIRSQLNRVSSGSSRGKISLVTGPIEDIKIPPEVAATVPDVGASLLSPLTWVRAIPALINWAAPQRMISLVGYLHKPGSNGVGVSVQLEDSGNVLTSYTFWHRDFDDPSEPSQDALADSLYQLAEYAAIWLVFEMAKMHGSALKLLGTDNWRSYAYFRAGFFAEKQSRQQAAKTLYINALQVDPKLRSARVNLAVWCSNHQEPDLAIEQLKRAKKECLSARDGDRDPTLYSAIYNLAALLYDEEDVQSAKEQTVELLKIIDATLKCIKAKKKGYTDPALKYHLTTIRPVASTMHGGFMVELGEAGGRKLIEDEANLSSVFPRLQFNLACGYSLLAEHAKPKNNESREQYLNKSLAHLERSFYFTASVVNQVEEDRSLKYVLKEKPNEIRALIYKYRIPATETLEPKSAFLLADVQIIGKEHAQSLAKENILTQDQLLQKTLDATARQKLAGLLTVTERLVTKWAHTMDLLRIVGIGTPELQLLSMAEIHSLTLLENSNPAQLKALLDDLSKADGQIDPPDLTAVSAWVNDARSNTKPKVS